MNKQEDGLGRQSVEKVPMKTLQNFNSLPKIGIILSPGGLKSFAHIGVLRSFENSRIPVYAISGIEWGALVAGLYSVKGKANDVEWKLQKLPTQLLPRYELLGRDLVPTNITEYSRYLNDIFENKSFSNGQIPFSCPTRAIKKSRTMIIQRGGFAEAIELCLPYPPITRSQQWWAAPFDIKTLAEAMRRQGAEYIILVNVIPGIQDLKTNIDSNKILWSEVVEEMTKASDVVNMTISINIQDKDMLDFESRREFVRIGEEYGKITSEQLAKRWGLQ